VISAVWAGFGLTLASLLVLALTFQGRLDPFLRNSLEVLPPMTDRLGASFLNTAGGVSRRTLESHPQGARIWMEAHENRVVEWLKA
jgi:hypothetical protein